MNGVAMIDGSSVLCFTIVWFDAFDGTRYEYTWVMN
jgi:hypothetical protein